MKYFCHFLFLGFFSVFFQFSLHAQETPSDSSGVSWDWYHIVKQNGVEYIAQIISDDGREILIYTRDLGKLFIQKSDIKSMKKIDNPDEVISGQFQYAGPFTTRYYLTTNALPIKKGENYSMLHLWGPEVHFAVSNSTSVGLMSSWIGSPMALAVKQNFKTKNPRLNFSLGTIMGTSGYFNTFRGYGGLHFGNFTYGNRLSNITASAGICYIQPGNLWSRYEHEGYQEYTSDTGPDRITAPGPIRFAKLFSVSGITKVGAKASFVFDVLASFTTRKSTYQEVSDNQLLEAGSYDPVTQTFTPDRYSMVVTSYTVTERNYFFVFMPGMRFQKTDDKAFQFSLAGVLYNNDGNINTFPIPMCAWMIKF